MKVTPSTRRQFIKTTATAVTAFNLLPRHVLGGPRFVPPSEKVNAAVVGVGGRGLQNMRALLALSDVQVIAVADPAESFSLEDYYYKGRGGRLPAVGEVEKHYAAKTPNYRCAAYEDFRVMLEKEKSIDAVLCATPDHLHAYVSLRAMRAGKHVYCEKPLTHNIHEAREVARVAAETGLATQMGNQGHSTPGMRETVEYVRAGVIGAVREIHAWVGTKRWNPGLVTKPAEAQAVPAGMNWDLWLGPREPRAFNAAYHPVSWRDFWQFGGSSMGDFGCHDLDAATWAFDLSAPTRAEAVWSGPNDDEIAPHGCQIFYDFPAHGAQPPIRLTWHDGGLRPRNPDALGAFPLPKRGVLFVGEKGAIQCDGAGGAPRVFPESLRASMTKPAQSLKRSNGHHRDWIDACKGGDAASSNFSYGARLTEIALLGVLALRARKPIAWDAANLKATGLPETEPMIRGTYRAGWELPT
ncbi:Gfo/Idh/MocA family protein [Horticoccus sp. 23ND18S-11]|uniref:Gfo/Idh/MocA family protein n=1 Tax=Horticoccus sp. 23ND18S-11 TaxID=3391832 RepID=UPI0039C9BC80